MRAKKTSLLVAAVISALAPAGPAGAERTSPLTTELVNVDDAGRQGLGQANRPALGDDGKLVGFVSGASNLVPRDDNDAVDVFIRNRKLSDTQLMSVSSSGRRANDDSEGVPCRQRGDTSSSRHGRPIS